MTVLEFKDAILNQMKQEYPEMDEYVLTEDDLARIQEIRDTQFATWDWTYGQTPEYTVERAFVTQLVKLQPTLRLKNQSLNLSKFMETSSVLVMYLMLKTY